MIVKKIYYKKLFNLGEYQNEEIGIELEVEEGDMAADVLERAKQFVNKHDPDNKSREEYLSALLVLENKESKQYNEVIEAKAIVERYEAANDNKPDDLPF